MSEGLLIPALALGLLGWLVPKLWSMLLPEGIGPLVLNAILSALTLVTITGLYFMLSYWRAGVSWGRLLDQGLIGNFVYFGHLGLASAIIWGPLMGISIMGLPRTWVRMPW